MAAGGGNHAHHHHHHHHHYHHHAQGHPLYHSGADGGGSKGAAEVWGGALAIFEVRPAHLR